MDRPGGPFWLAVAFVVIMRAITAIAWGAAIAVGFFGMIWIIVQVFGGLPATGREQHPGATYPCQAPSGRCPKAGVKLYTTMLRCRDGTEPIRIRVPFDHGDDQ